MDTIINQIFITYVSENRRFFTYNNWFFNIFAQLTFSLSGVKEIWYDGIKRGIELGLSKSSLEGQKIELNSNTILPKNKEFLEKYHELVDKYDCVIRYHTLCGLVVVDRQTRRIKTAEETHEFVKYNHE